MDFGFTDLEKKVIAIALENRFDYSIAARLGMSRDEVVAVMASVREKVGVPNRALAIDILRRMQDQETANP